MLFPFRVRERKSVPAPSLLSLRGWCCLLGVRRGSSDVSPQSPDQRQHCWQLRMVFILCPEGETMSLCIYKVKGKGGSSAFSFLQHKVSPSLAVGMQLHSSCFLFLSFSLCSAKIVSVTHLYPAGKVTCGQCCKTPGGSCGCCTEMTYVKVTKYTQKL